MNEISRGHRRMIVAALAEEIDAELVGNGDAEVDGCAGLEEATPADVSFLTRVAYASQVADSRAAAVILSAESAEKVGHATLLIADDPYFAFRQAVVALYGFRRQPAPGVSELASVADDATLGEDVSIGPFAYVGEGAAIGARTVLHANTHVARGARIGEDAILYPGVSVYDECVVGNRVILHSNAVVGQDGFGHATHAGAHHKIPQVGIAIIEDDVEIGANCSIDRGTLGATVIGKGTKMSNNVVVGHGSKVGEHNLMVAFVGLAGSVETGDYVVIGGMSGIVGHLKVGGGTQIAAHSLLTKNSEPGQKWYGMPAIEMGRGQRAAAVHAKLPEMAKELRALRRQVDELQKKLDGDE